MKPALSLLVSLERVPATVPRAPGRPGVASARAAEREARPSAAAAAVEGLRRPRGHSWSASPAVTGSSARVQRDPRAHLSRTETKHERESPSSGMESVSGILTGSWNPSMAFGILPGNYSDPLWTLKSSLNGGRSLAYRL